MKRILGFVAGAMLMAGAVYAATTIAQTYRNAGNGQPFYGRSDGLFADATHKILKFVDAGKTSAVRDAAAQYFDFTTLTDQAQPGNTFQFDGTAYDGTADVLNIFTMPDGARFGVVAIVGQTLGPDPAAGYLDMALDQTDNDGWEMVEGIPLTSGRPLKIGTDPAFYTCLDFSIADGNGTDDFHVGFRRAEVVNGTVDNYLDMATLSIVTVANPALIQIETILNNGATTTTSTTNTIADGVRTKWCVYVSAAGVVTYTIDGAAPTATASFTFDTGDPVVPFIQLLQANAAQTGAVKLYSWEVNFQ